MQKGKRKTQAPCERCFLHLDFCICSELYRYNNKTQVDLVVHYKELKRTTNSGRLIKECLQNQKIWVRGEKDAVLDYEAVLQKDKEPLFLYPSDDAVTLTTDLVQKIKRPIQLIVSDGNWRQASKVHYRVEAFKSLLRVKLPPEESEKRESFHLRRESKFNGMATLEAIGKALGIIEGQEVGLHVLKAFELKLQATLKARGQL